jgi:hypothetical protein
VHLPGEDLSFVRVPAFAKILRIRSLSEHGALTGLQTLRAPVVMES